MVKAVHLMNLQIELIALASVNQSIVYPMQWQEMAYPNTESMGPNAKIFHASPIYGIGESESHRDDYTKDTRHVSQKSSHLSQDGYNTVRVGSSSSVPMPQYSNTQPSEKG